jgi:class 3 adenylate cyclase
MAAAGLSGICVSENKEDRFTKMNPVNKIVLLALEMMHISQKVTYGDEEKIKLKIGIHYGRVIAGLIGHHK